MRPVVQDDDSVESLLSDWNDDAEEDELEALKEKLAFRESLLQHILQGKDASFAKTLRDHESLIMEEALKFVERNQAPTKARGKGKVVRKEKGQWKCPEEKTEQGESQRLRNKTNAEELNKQLDSSIKGSKIRTSLLFEMYYAVPGFLAVISYCSLHLAAYMLVESLFVEGSRYCRIEDLYYLGSIVACLMMTRLTGGIWDWLSLSRHDIVRSELQRRYRLGHWDARLHLWFRRHQFIKAAIDHFALYGCLVAVYHFHNRLLISLFDDRSWILDNLPSRRHGVDTTVALTLQRRNTLECQADESNICTLLGNLNDQDAAYLYSKVAITSYFAIIGSTAAVLASPMALRSASSILAVLNWLHLKKLGFQWD